MQNPYDGSFMTGKSLEELNNQRQAFEAALEPAKRNSLFDDRDWPIFREGETVYVRNESGAEAKCVVEGFGKKFIRLRGIPK